MLGLVSWLVVKGMKIRMFVNDRIIIFILNFFRCVRVVFIMVGGEVGVG